MTKAQQQHAAKHLLRRHSRTFAEEIGIRPESNKPAQLFAVLLEALLCSARISHSIALKTTRVVLDRGWTTPKKLAATTWQHRVDAMGDGGYVRYDESTSTMLGETVGMLLERYKGDLRNLRKEAERDPARERKLLKEFKGIGDVGADIFFREAQVAWPELYPFADKRATETARDLGLPRDATNLAGLVRGRQKFARLVTALIRVQLAGQQDEIRAALRE